MENLQRIFRSGFMPSAFYLATLFLSLDAHAEGWVTSELTRFSLKLSHPPSFKRMKGVWEQPGFQGSISAGNTDTITDGTMSVTLEGSFGGDGETFESHWQDELQNNGSFITYKVKRGSWFVVSGVDPKGTEFYRKYWLLPGGGFTFKATYPHARNKVYDPVLERMLKTFEPGLGEGPEHAPRNPIEGTTVSEQQAVRIVSEKLGWELPEGGRLEFDHTEKKAGRDYLVVHGYNLAIDDPANGTGHTATWGWYYVDAQTGAAYEWDMVADKLEKMKQVTFR